MEKYAKPFLKWAGGKTQLLDKLEACLPKIIKEKKYIKNYVEPFIGGGAFFFYLNSKYKIEKSLISDINKEIIVSYKVIKNNPKELIYELKNKQSTYLEKNTEERKKLYYKIRKEYNNEMYTFDYNSYNEQWIKRASSLIFLNKTCFNGLFRQNKIGEFNVPAGKYKNPKICDTENIIAVNKALENTEIKMCDFEETKKYVTPETVVYLDPPYRPLNQTSSFTSYSKNGFSDLDQIRLSKYYSELDKLGANLILSNSDPKNHNPNDSFFDELYKNFNIKRVKATRMINRNPKNRGQINEIIIAN